MADVAMSLREAQRGLPAICAMTGERAEGAVPLAVGRTWTRWNSPTVRIPMSEAIFTKWSRRQGTHIKARGAASLLTAVGVALAFRTTAVALGVLALAVAIHLLDLWAERSAAEFRPRLERHGSMVHILGIDDRFSRALVEMGAERLQSEPSPT